MKVIDSPEGRQSEEVRAKDEEVRHALPCVIDEQSELAVFVSEAL
jgi:hypothetical protein